MISSNVKKQISKKVSESKRTIHQKKLQDDIKKHVTTLNHCNKKPQVMPMEANDLLDELKTLKSRITLLTAENDSLKTKCRQLNTQLIKKDKELTNLTDPTENAKLLQSLGDNRPQTVRMFRQLHQKLFKLEGQLKEKDAEYNRIVTDLKYTRVEELRVQLETAFSEVERLQNLIRSQSIELNHLRDMQQRRANKKKNDPEWLELVRRVKTLGQVIKSMDEQKKELTARNDYLVNRMHQILANDPSSMKEIERGLAQLENQEEQEAGHEENVQRSSVIVAKMVESKRLAQLENQEEQEAGHEENVQRSSVIVAKMVESKLSDGVRYQQPVARPIPTRNDFADELVSVRSQANSFELNNQQLREEVTFYKKQMELSKLQLDEASEAPSSVRTFGSSPRMKSPKKPQESNPAGKKSVPTLTKEEHSVILIQRAWREHRGRCLELRQKEKAQNMQQRAEDREEEVATQLIKSALQGHLSRESSLRVSGKKNTVSDVDELDTETFATEEEVAILSEEEQTKSLNDLKAAVQGHLEREKSLNSLDTPDQF